MTLQKIWTLMIFCAFPFLGIAQYQHTCHNAKLAAIHHNSEFDVADNRENNYDVTYIHLDVSVSNMKNSIEGNVTTQAKALSENFNEYVFELSADLKIDSVLINGEKLSVQNIGAVRIVAIPQVIPQGSLFTAQVFYLGQPQQGEGFFSKGIRNDYNEEWDVRATYTLSEPYFAADWFPVKQSLQDKIDSTDVWITVTDDLMAGSIGLLQNVTTLSNGKKRYEWKHRYAVSYYLISLAVAPYQEYSYYVHFENSSDSMLFQNYIYDRPDYLEKNKEQIDETVKMIHQFSRLFGRYPFWQEKYGHCITPLGGGMEHQTMSTMGNFGKYLVAHELAHQWFGDNVTCATWADLWLNEGFASYLEYLYSAEFESKEISKKRLDDLHHYASIATSGKVYNTDTIDVNRVFNYPLTYAKPAVVIHTLRYLFGNDSLFFTMLKDYQEIFALGNASTNDFILHVNEYVGSNMFWFFEEWIYGEGYPVIDVIWNQVDNDVYFELKQNTSVPFSDATFQIPLEIKFISENSDTTITIPMNKQSEIFTFKWSNSINRLEIDPANWVLNGVGKVAKNKALYSLSGADTNMFYVYPNPAAHSWHIDGIPKECRFFLFDISGRIVWEGYNGDDNFIEINSENLSKGTYTLRAINKAAGVDKSLKLVKK